MPKSALQSGTIIGEKYRLIDSIGTGGFSRVYRGVHTGMNREVAIKIFDPEDEDNSNPQRTARRRSRFEREARLVSQLDHPNTVTTFDFGVEEDGKLYLVMEFIEGSTLKEILKQHGALSEERSVAIFLQILASLEQAHHLGILHRDLKPANIMLTSNFKGEEIVKVLDFGIAKMLSDPRREMSARGKPLFVGTPRYAAPEQLAAKALSVATDIFGVGALLWESLLGQKMVPSVKLEDCVAFAASPEPWTLPDDTSLPFELAEIIEKAVRKVPSDRFQSASEMIAAIEESTTIQLEDLPEIKPSPFSAQHREILDPNITDPDDSQNFFLQGGFDPGASAKPGAPPPMPGAKLPKRKPTPAPQQPRRSRPPRRSCPQKPDSTTKASASSLELDESALRPRRPSEKKPAPRKVSPSASPSRSRSPFEVIKDLIDDYGGLLVVTIASIAAVVIVVLLIPLFTGSDTVETPDIQVAADEDRQPQLVLTNRSAFSVDGIQIAIRTAGWRVDNSRPPVNVGTFEYHPMVISRDDITLDVTIYESGSQNALDDIVEAVQFPSQYIILGHIAVRINPRDTDGYEPASQLRDRLGVYRNLVLEESAKILSNP